MYQLLFSLLFFCLLRDCACNCLPGLRKEESSLVFRAESDSFRGLRFSPARSDLQEHWARPVFMSTRYFHYLTFSVSEQRIASEKHQDKEKDYWVCCRGRRLPRVFTAGRLSRLGFGVDRDRLISGAEKGRRGNGNFESSMRFCELNLHLQRVFQQMNRFDGSVKRKKSNTLLLFIRCLVVVNRAV